ncbi:MAG: methyltransferase [Terriglobales bacterium]|jgi:methylase of polypeptide subunit release factors
MRCHPVQSIDHEIKVKLQPMTERAPLVARDTDVPELRAVLSKLAAVGYSERGVSERLGLEDLAGLRWHPLPIYRAERLARRDRLDLAIDLFLLQGALPAGQLERLFTRSECDALVRVGLVAIDEEAGTARARASLFPVAKHLIFSDHAWPELPHPGYSTVPSDHVMAIGPDSRKLARCTTRRPCRTALDLCTGSGIHALLASRHSSQVVAVDINPRAALCTRFNAQASGVANLEVVVGDLFDAVRGQHFDLITANPPFVPSPLDSLRFRDGGRSGEDIQKRIVAGLPDHLAPGGRAQMVTELGEREGETLVPRLREWLAGAPMDIHILRLGEHTAANYALGHAKGDDYETFLASIDDWATNLRTQGYARIVSVVISLQWSDASAGPPWERVDLSPPPLRAAGAEIDAVFRAERRMRQPDWQQALKRSCLRRSGPVAILGARVMGTDLQANTKATLLGQALKIDHQLDPVEYEILERINDRERTPAQDLIDVFRDPHREEPTVLAALRSLVQRQLVQTDGVG